MCRGIQWHPHGIFWRLCTVPTIMFTVFSCLCTSNMFMVLQVIVLWLYTSYKFCVIYLITNKFYRGMMGWVWVNQRDQTSVWTPTEIKHFTYVLHCIPILREVYWELFPLFSLEMFPNASSLDFFLWDSIWVLWLQYIYVACNVIISRCCAFRSWAGFLAFCIFIFKHFF